jgi:segregation and condensation protein B
MSEKKIKNIIEAALMVSTQPLSVKRLINLFEEDKTLQPNRDNIKKAIIDLQKDFEGRGVNLIEVASGFRFQADDEYADWVNHLFDERPPRYSRALLETLSIIAYRQPITRSEIEDIRGVGVSGTITKTLLEREWIKVVGHRDVPGRPELLATTKLFLDYFNLKKLSDLPPLEDIKDFDSINPDLFEALEKELGKDNNQTDDGDTISIIDSEETTTTEDVDDDVAESAKVIPFSN